jgi:hypothetical protein
MRRYVYNNGQLLRVFGSQMYTIQGQQVPATYSDLPLAMHGKALLNSLNFLNMLDHVSAHTAMSASNLCGPIPKNWQALDFHGTKNLAVLPQ